MTSSLSIPVIVTLTFATIGYAVKGVSVSGALAGAVVSFVLFAFAGPGAFAALVAVFVLTWIATRFGYSRKQQLGTAERGHGRNAFQVLANLGVATAMAASYGASHRNQLFLVCLCAALAEAAADTVSSEIGQACAEKARLITTLEAVPAGTDGGITWPGTFAGVVAATIVVLLCFARHLIALRDAPVAIFAAFVGTIADSLLGALFERRGYLHNDSVNFLSTAVAAATSALFHLFH